MQFVLQLFDLCVKYSNFLINDFTERDFCKSTPCLNGGVAVIPAEDTRAPAKQIILDTTATVSNEAIYFINIIHNFLHNQHA